MADGELVLCNLLCYLKSKYGKVGVKPLKSSIMDFYKVEDLALAKRQLINDVERLQLAQLPYIPERRVSDVQAARITDDLFTVFACLDELIKLKDLPCYVADSPDSMPSVRLYDGDLAVLMTRLQKIDDRITGHDSVLAAIASDLRTCRVAAKSSDAGQACPPDININDGSWPEIVRPAGETAITFGNSTQSAVHKFRQSADDPTHQKSLASMARIGWAAITSSPVEQSNRFSVLRSDGDCDSDAEPFTDVRSKGTKRQRQYSRQQQQQQSTSQSVGEPTSLVQRIQQQSQQNRRQQARRLLLGTSTASTRSLAAARVITKKAVFCVDNIDVSYDADDVRSFVSSLAVTVVSCFQVKPRRRRDESGPVNDRRAFRLCIDDADRDRLLDASKWPDSVIISQWYYKSPPSGVNQQRSAGHAAVPSSSAAATMALSAPTSTSAVVVTMPTASGSTSTSTPAVLAVAVANRPSPIPSVTLAPSSSASIVATPAVINEENMEVSSDADNNLDSTLAYHDGV